MRWQEFQWLHVTESPLCFSCHSARQGCSSISFFYTTVYIFPLQHLISLAQNGGLLRLPASLIKDSGCESEDFKALPSREETGCSAAFLFRRVSKSVSAVLWALPDGRRFSSPHREHLSQSITSTKYLNQVCRELKCGPSGTAPRTSLGTSQPPRAAGVRSPDDDV